MDQVQYDRLLSYLLTEDPALSRSESENYMLKGRQLYYKEKGRELEVRS